nr:hypothetical protein [Streptomyces guryensis]
MFSTYRMKTSCPATPTLDRESAMAAQSCCLIAVERPACVKI